MLQQYLPFMVLKLFLFIICEAIYFFVATVLTVYGIETQQHQFAHFLEFRVATVLTACGIET
ncbi:MAG: hypothetical protein E6X90_06635 [Veillonella sp.]|nr:hypothetical protein [Veillonella sp.]